ncbi:hypothetical protein GCM10010250_67120 [Streptomyces althioticus]|nr:hypothetical protein GCM10010250_67120 [Streptomyces althioticus]
MPDRAGGTHSRGAARSRVHSVPADAEKKVSVSVGGCWTGPICIGRSAPGWEQDTPMSARVDLRQRFRLLPCGMGCLDLSGSLSGFGGDLVRDADHFYFSLAKQSKGVFCPAGWPD